MSFSSETKDELTLDAKLSGAGEKRALLCGVTHAAGSMTLGRGDVGVQYITESANVAALTARLAAELYGVASSVVESRRERLNAVNMIVRLSGEGARRLLTDFGFLGGEELELGHIPQEIAADDARTRCFLRGVFLGAGSASDPSKGYHLELVCKYEAFAAELCGLIQGFGIKAKYAPRKSSFVVYLKEGEMVSDFLTLIGAMKSTLAFEDARIYRSISNEVNRRQNFDEANMNKAATAAAQQLLDIEAIRAHRGLQSLPPRLFDAAEARINNPEATLQELAEMVEISKSGLNHRFEKLSRIAQELRDEHGGVV